MASSGAQPRPAHVKQQKDTLVNYHYLCAALQQKYEIRHCAPCQCEFEGCNKNMLDFSSYTAYKLRPVELRTLPNENGTIDTEDLKKLHEALKNRPFHAGSEGLLSYVQDRDGILFSVIMAYNGPGGTCGDKKWDRVFDRMKAKGYKQRAVPCMYFATKQGCVVDKCPYSHKNKASLRLRAEVLLARRQILFEPTPKQYLADFKKRMKNEGWDAKALQQFMREMAMKELNPDHETLPNDVSAPRAHGYCARLACVKPYLFAMEKAPLQQCSRCKWTYYCSEACQRKDWSRHKGECAPEEEVITNNKLWSYFGLRLGTNIQNLKV
ncbi:hypothetical protein SCHPADRAFT_461994 [Schizopora paradoxa]|uniref:MYND-type domain-containing protein n=1 Tax=Schizopora paradoxa TaxID=27342 RepID=A0A0H2RIP6_9AGAM|nr:hypothetical protein SCHPADRAFT_461994 [Schizopora paradoxa]